MNSRAFTLAIIIAGVAMFMVWSYIDGQTKELIQRYGVESSVVIAKVDINQFDNIDDSKIMTITVPQKFLAPGHFKKIEELDNTIAITSIAKGEQITMPRVEYPGVKTGLSRQVSVGKRAIAINVTERQGVGKLIKPGDRVDILAAIDYAAGRRDKQKIITVLQDVLVLSTGYSLTNSLPIVNLKGAKDELMKLKLDSYTQYNVVTLEVTPYDAQNLAYLMTFTGAQPFLILRNNNDKEKLTIKPTRLIDVLDAQESEEAKKYFEYKYKDDK